MLLKDKVAIITGAASARGLGFATAKLFAENGASVVIIDLNDEASKAAAAAPAKAILVWQRTSPMKFRCRPQSNRFWRNMAGSMCW